MENKGYKGTHISIENMKISLVKKKSASLTRRVIVEKYVLEECEIELFGNKTIFWKSVYEGELEWDNEDDVQD